MFEGPSPRKTFEGCMTHDHGSALGEFNKMAHIVRIVHEELAFVTNAPVSADGDNRIHRVSDQMAMGML